MDTIFIPAAASPRIAASRPEPTPLMITLMSSSPVFRTFSTTVLETIVAAYGVAFLAPLNPNDPAELHARVFPERSASDTNVLLYVD